MQGDLPSLRLLLTADWPWGDRGLAAGPQGWGWRESWGIRGPSLQPELARGRGNRTSRKLPLCQESASGDSDVKSRGPGRWVGGKDSRAADKDFLLVMGALRPVAGVTVETPRRIQSLTQYTFTATGSVPPLRETKEKELVPVLRELPVPR